MRILQVWQYGGSVAAERSLDDAIILANACGFDALLCKALDGTTWMGAIDSSPDALSSATEIASQQQRAHAAGLRYFVWTNPLWTVDRSRQADLTAEAALAADGLFLDAEPYDQFWGAWRPTGDARAFMERIRQRAPGAFLVLQPDPRPQRLLELRPEEWLPYVQVLSGQHYWSDFQRPPTVEHAKAELAQAQEMGRVYGVKVWPTVPGNAPIETFPVNSLGEFESFVVWRMGSTPMATLQLLGAVPQSGAQEPPASTAPTAAEFRQALSYLRHDVMEPLRAYRYAKVKAAVAEVERVAAQYGAA